MFSWPSRTRGCLLIGLGLLAGCAATPEPAPEPVRTAPAIEPPPPARPSMQNDKLKHLANRKLKPIETRALNSRASCGFRDPNGYHGQLRMDVKEASVKRFEASVNIPKHGNCKFRLADFQQTESLPIVVMSARTGGCKIRLWEQEDKVTVAFNNCQTACSGNAVEYLWPILVDNRKGSCS